MISYAHKMRRHFQTTCVFQRELEKLTDKRKACDERMGR